MEHVFSLSRTWLLPLILLAAYGSGQAQGIGIGTTKPSSNAALDVSSTSKGLMLPRLQNTAAVVKPSAGLFIYNKKLQAPAYHDGTRWNTLAAAADGGTAAAGQPDSITYTVAGGSLKSGVFGGVIDLNHGITNAVSVGAGGGAGAGKASFSEVVITKCLDANSIPFAKAVANGAVAATTLEIKAYVTGAANPSYSIKLTSVRVTAYTVKMNAGAALVEQLSLTGTIFGYRDWVANQQFGWNVAMNKMVPY